MGTRKYYLKTAAEVLSLLKEDKLSVVKYAKDLLARIQERDGVVKASTHSWRE
jgi:hypothetical protein